MGRGARACDVGGRRGKLRRAKCGGRMWDNRATKRNPKAPDFKCRDRACDGVIWPPKAANARPAQQEEIVLDAAPLATGTDDIPF